jgi:hypothetical protein
MAIENPMKSFINYLTETKNEGSGDCMKVAAQLMLQYHTDFFGKRLKANGSPVLIHALVWGKGALMGKRFSHAWVEDGDMVIDRSNGRSKTEPIPKSVYYRLGNVEPNEAGAYKKYEYADMKKFLSSTKHYGPWELDEKLEESLMKMGSKGEIGKKRQRVSTDLLKSLAESIDEAIVTTRPSAGSWSRTGGSAGVRSYAHAPARGQGHTEVTANDLKRLESVLDAMFSSAKLDIGFTRHFLERINGSRGYGGTVTIPEILDAFRKTCSKYGKEIEKHPADWKAIINDVSKDLNMPFVLNWDGRMKKMIMVTAMKKKDFLSDDPKLKV